jgi:hypothetical protein
MVGGGGGGGDRPSNESLGDLATLIDLVGVLLLLLLPLLLLLLLLLFVLSNDRRPVIEGSSSIKCRTKMELDGRLSPAMLDSSSANITPGAALERFSDSYLDNFYGFFAQISGI